MPRILVTGANGFLGRYATEALAKDGWDVVGSGRTAPQTPALDFVAADLLEEDGRARAVEAARADTLLHLAWYDDPRARWTGPENLDWVAATLALARRFAQVGGKRFIFGSSCAVYDFKARARHRECDTLAPASLYGHAKAACSTLLLAGAPAMGLSVAEVRMFFCYGAGEPAGRLIPDLLSGLSRGDAVACTDGRQKRDYLHASDIGRALSLVASSDFDGPINIGSGQSIPVANLIEELARQVGRPDLPQLGSLARAPDDPPEITADTTKLAELGFRPSVDLTSGVEDTLRRHRSEGAT